MTSFLELEINTHNEIDLIENNKEISQLEGLRSKTNKLIKELIDMKDLKITETKQRDK